MNDTLLGPCALEGKFVRLEPLRANHAAALTEAGGKLDWAWTLAPLRSREDVDQRIVDGLKAERRHEEYAFAVVLKRDGQVVGSTSYLAIVPKHKRAEIGQTWYEPNAQGTAVNPECKLLLLKHAFEDWGAVRMQLCTDANNVHSQRAIVKLGAKFEGNLRNYGVGRDGYVREAAFVYSITSGEWPTVKRGLEARVEKFR